MPPSAAHDDAELVTASLSGNRDAFGRIVSRYQSLICSLTYSATGNIGQSEDLAQETFVTAWAELRLLREPGKLRPWLCGIARNLTNQSLRRQGREALRQAESLDAVHELPTAEPQPCDHAISKEEEAILWRSLENIPELYREPLVLFYRENQSIETVARNLELSEDAVKQRLSRGRKMLAAEVTAFVEGALKMSAPSRGFMIGVLAALPVLTTSANAATVAATAAKGSAAAKASVALGLSGALLGPLIGFLGAWFGVKASLAHATSKKERQLIIRFTKVIAGMVIVTLIGMGLVLASAYRPNPASPSLAVSLAVGFIVLYSLGLVGLILRFNRQQSRIRKETEEMMGTPASSGPDRSPLEYRSRWTLLGLPLVHIRLGKRPNEKLRPALGWIAIGDFAVGVLFAAGGIAVGGVSMAGASLGIISLGGVAMGGLSLGGLAIGGAAIGGVSIGYLALGGCAMAWQAAVGGLAVAHHFAAGGVAQAQHANDAIAKTFTDAHPFFHYGMQVLQYSRWLLLLCLIPIGIIVGAANHLRQRQQAERQKLLGLALLFSLLFGTASNGAAPGMDSASLPNGIRVLSVYFPKSTGVSIFTFVPLGLASDAPDRAQWSHLVEHMVIRSTVPAGSAEANAETLPDHMRLDFYGDTSNWKKGLQHHLRWLEGIPFSEAILADEKPKVNAECDFTARAFTTHKFAVAAWSQGLRYGRKHIALKGDVAGARLDDLQRYRDERLAVSTKVTVCVVGGVPARDVVDEVKRDLGGLQLRGTLPVPGKVSNRDLELTWDLDARHLLLTWTIPDAASKEYAALMVAAQALNIKIFADSELKPLTGMTLAGCDLATPEGTFFFISAALRPEARVENVHARLTAILKGLTVDTSASMIGRQLGDSLTTIPDLQAMMSEIPNNAGLARLQGNWGLQFGMSAHRYGNRRKSLAQELAGISAGQVQAVIRKYLSNTKAAACVLSPRTEAAEK